MMDSSKNKENNLFMWATKELSQDAIVAWLLNMDNNIGEKFLKAMIKVQPKVDILPNDFKIVNIKTQYEKIDVLVDIEHNGITDAIIIEDKADTFLHDYQMLKYIEKISKKKYNNIYYVLFKSGEIYSWEKAEYEKFQKEINDNDRKHYKYTADDLNSDIKFNGLPIKDLYTGKDIDFENKPSNSVVVCDIFSNEDFEKFSKNIVIPGDWNKKTLEMISKSFNSANNKKEDYYTGYKKITEFLENNYTLHMAMPGGSGKRPYELCIYNENFFKIEESNEINKNYLILPYIKWTDKNIEFKINYYFIADLNKANGYMPFKKLIEKYNNKEKLLEVKEKLISILNKDKSTVKFTQRDDGLLILSFSILKKDSAPQIEKLLENLMEYSKEAVEIIANIKNI